MIVPILNEDYENKNLIELILERKKIMNKIIEIEKEYYFNKNNDFIIQEPSYEVILCTLNKDLILLTKIIQDKLKNN